MALEHLSPLTAEQLLKARLRAALAYVQDVVADADLLPLDARVQVLRALSGLTEALALVQTQEH